MSLQTGKALQPNGNVIRRAWETPVNPRLVAISGPLKDSVFALPIEDLSLGRDASNGLPISDPSVSRRHCVLRREGTEFKIIDLESRNGTFVMGRRLAAPSRLVDGDEFSLGAVRFTLRVSAAPTLCDTDEEPAR